jgi:hypothetical protein
MLVTDDIYILGITKEDLEEGMSALSLITAHCICKHECSHKLEPFPLGEVIRWKRR